MPDIAIIDYGVGNLRSVEKAFAAAGHEAVISNNETILRRAKGLVLPGVGAFGACMKALAAHGFDELVRERVLQGTPLLGVCVGMQMLFEESDEFGKTAGLGLLCGRVRRFSDELVVPAVGWNQIRKQSEHPLLREIEDGAFFYFVHSYYCEPADEAIVLCQTDYGNTYASVIAQDNLYGVQFHPEKSQTVGQRLLSNFASRVRLGVWHD